MSDCNLPGHNPLAVMDLIASRRSQPNRRDDRRLALLVEGGAMRGVYSAGSLLALHLMGLQNCFDHLFGTSAGAVNGAHFLSGIGETKVSTYYKHLNGRKFINTFRLTKMVDIDYFVDDILNGVSRIETELINAAPCELWVAVLNKATAQVELHSPRLEKLPLMTLLKAAVALPVVYGKTVELMGQEYMDAGFAQPFPLGDALKLGITDALVITARPIDYRSRPHKFWQNMLFDRRCAKGSKPLQSLYRQSWIMCNKERALAAGGQSSLHGANIATLAPSSLKLKATTTNATLLRSEMISMCRQVLTIFQEDHTSLDALIANDVI